MTAQKPREIAFRVLQQREQAHDYTESLLEPLLPSLTPVDRGLCQELVYGVVRWQATLDWLITRKTAPGRNQKTALRTLLRLGLYQLFWLDRIPDHAAVHETVALARHAGFGPQAGFINALLRAYSRERDATRQLLADLKQTEPHLGYSHPEWLCLRWRDRWGRLELDRLLDWNNTPPKTFARVNSLRVTPETLLPRWRDEGVTYDFFTRDWTGEGLMFELKDHPPLADLPSFRDGCFYIQDPSTLLAVRELDPQPGEAILDLCAAPGGKATCIAQRMENRGRLAAQDLNRQRLELLRANCERLGVTCAEFTCNTGIAVPELTARVDRVLVDVPCSNTGVLRRRVDLRWRIRPEEIFRLRTTQLELLQDGAHQTRDGGRLVYSTCSLEPEENHDLVREFLAANPAFRLERERQLLPFRDGVDGAYVATLTRIQP